MYLFFSLIYIGKCRNYKILVQNIGLNILCKRYKKHKVKTKGGKLKAKG